MFDAAHCSSCSSLFSRIVATSTCSHTRAWIQSEKSKALTRTCVATKFECGSMRANPVSSSTVVALDGNDGYVVFVVLVLGGDQPRQALLHTPAAA